MTAGSVAAPVQARAKRSYHRMIDATVELLADRPFDSITIDEIAARAGYTKGAFYHRFDDKASLLRHLLARLTEGAEASWSAFLEPGQWTAASLAEVLEGFVDRLVAIYSRSANLMGAFTREARWGQDPAIRAIAAALNARVVEGLAALVRARSGELAPALRDDPDGAVRFWATTLIAALRSIYLWPDPGIEPDRDPTVVRRRMGLLIAPMLDVPSPASPGDSGTES